MNAMSPQLRPVQPDLPRRVLPLPAGGGPEAPVSDPKRHLAAAPLEHRDIGPDLDDRPPRLACGRQRRDREEMPPLGLWAGHHILAQAHRAEALGAHHARRPGREARLVGDHAGERGGEIRD